MSDKKQTYREKKKIYGKEKLSMALSVSFTPSQYEKVTNYCLDRNLTLNAFVRNTVLKAVEESDTQ